MATLSFTYKYMIPGDFDLDVYAKIEDLMTILGDVLTHIIEEGTTGNCRIKIPTHDTESSTK